MDQATTSTIQPDSPPHAQPQAQPLRLQLLPALGAALANGLFCGLTTKPDGTHHAVVLLTDTPAERLKWADAMAWAEGLGEGAHLPSRPVAALLFANAKPQFVEEWHWTGETCEWDSSSAWGQYFTLGTQNLSHESYAGRARAVRLIQLTA